MSGICISDVKESIGGRTTKIPSYFSIIQKSKGPDLLEFLKIYTNFSIEYKLKTYQKLHNMGFLHMDIKP